jgi:hypothetical protein
VSAPAGENFASLAHLSSDAFNRFQFNCDTSGAVRIAFPGFAFMSIPIKVMIITAVYEF